MNLKYINYLLSFKLPSTSLLNKLKFVLRPLILPIDKIINEIPAHTSVFDYGCGQGQLMLLLHKFNRNKGIKGVEVIPELVNNANYLLSQINLKSPVTLQEGLVPPREIRSFQSLILIDVLHHIPLNRRYKFLLEVREKMSAKSQLVIKDISADNRFLQMLNKFHDLFLSGEIGHELTTKEFKDILNRCNFKISKIVYSPVLWYNHIIFICNPS